MQCRVWRLEGAKVLGEAALLGDEVVDGGVGDLVVHNVEAEGVVAGELVLLGVPVG
jgi:hypothetical protein